MDKPVTSPSSGIRLNKGKPRWDLLSWGAIAQLVDVITFGATKYAARNWELGLSFSDTFASLQRHLTSWYNGENYDPETKLHHMAHVMCNAMFLMHFVLTGTGTDDRPLNKKEEIIERPFVPTHLKDSPEQLSPERQRAAAQRRFYTVQQAAGGQLGIGNPMEHSGVSDLQADIRETAERIGLLGRTGPDRGVEGHRNTGIDRD